MPRRGFEPRLYQSGLLHEPLKDLGFLAARQLLARMRAVVVEMVLDCFDKVLAAVCSEDGSLHVGAGVVVAVWQVECHTPLLYPTTLSSSQFGGFMIP
jgi:hypothetical protein